MRGFKALLYKEFRLFFRGPGLAALLLPVLLLPALRFGLADTGGLAAVRAFPIAVRDLDGTVMSRSLLAQMGQIELFSEIIPAGAEDPDSTFLDEGCAAVVTIPKDFFYELYTMSDCPVDVTLNTGMELESALFRSVFTSVMEIIRSDQAAQRGGYRLCYGALTKEQERAMFAETAEHLFQDALGRQSVFDTAGESELQGALERRLTASLLAALAIFFAAAAVKTLPEERALGVLPRYRAAGGTRAAFAAAKLLAALALTVPALLLTAAVSETPFGVLLLTEAALLWGAFGLLLAAAVRATAAAAVQRWGNLLLLISLVLGGTLWPRALLPRPLPALSGLTLPGCALAALESAGTPALPGLLLPAVITGIAGICGALPGLSDRPRWYASGGKTPSAPDFMPDLSAGLRGTTGRLLGLTGCKLQFMSGGWPGLAVLLAAAALCGTVALPSSGVRQLTLAVCDLDGSILSQELSDRIGQQPGFSLTYCRETEGEQLLLRGAAEGLLVIPSGYGADLTAGKTPQLHYSAAASAVSVQGAREVAAGQAAAQRSRLRAVRLAEERLGHELSAEERELLNTYIQQAEEDAPALYRIAASRGAAQPEPFSPSPMGFAALAVLLALLTAAAWSGAEGEQSAQRMKSLPRGRWLSQGSDCMALTCMGLLIALAVLLPGGIPDAWAVPAALGCAFCSASLALLLRRMTVLEGRLDTFAPFLALLLCLLGGCFMDLTQLSGRLAGLALLTPPGLAVCGASGSPGALAGLAAEGCVFFALSFRR